ncbi:unnamed protein product, partial [Brenthis ino]
MRNALHDSRRWRNIISASSHIWMMYLWSHSRSIGAEQVHEDYTQIMNLADDIAQTRASEGLVQHLPIRDGSYEVARSLLTKRYHNERCLADAHIDQIMDLPVVSNTAQLRTELLNPLLIATNSLHRLGLPVAQWSYLLVRIVL